MPQRILGIDLGSSAVKAVLVESAHRSWTVRRAARAPVAAAVEGGPPLRARQMQALRDLLAGGELAFESAVVALPGPSAMHVVTLPFTDQRRIEQTIGFEVESQIPYDLTEVAWDWQPLRVADGKTDLLVAVVKKDELAATIGALEAAGVDARAVLPPGPTYAALLATGAVADAPPAEGDDGAVAVLDVGASRATVCLVSRGGCEAARTFPTGNAPTPAMLGRELRATVRAWRGRGGSGRPLRRILLAGEGRPAGLADALASEVDGPVEPLALAGPAAQVIPPEQAPSFALALAVALRGYQGPRAARLNLRRGELAFRGDFEHVRGKVVRLAAWAALVLLLAIVSSGVKVFALARHERLLDAALCDATQRLVGRCYTNDEMAVAALRGRGSVTAAIPKDSAVDVFTELSLRSPSSVALKFDRIEITRDKLHLQGTTDAAEDVDKIVTALRASRCFGEARSGGARKRASDGKFEFTIDSDLTCDVGEKASPARG